MSFTFSPLFSYLNFLDFQRRWTFDNSSQSRFDCSSRKAIIPSWLCYHVFVNFIIKMIITTVCIRFECTKAGTLHNLYESLGHNESIKLCDAIFSQEIRILGNFPKGNSIFRTSRWKAANSIETKLYFSLDFFNKLSVKIPLWNQSRNQLKVTTTSDQKWKYILLFDKNKPLQESLRSKKPKRNKTRFLLRIRNGYYVNRNSS